MNRPRRRHHRRPAPRLSSASGVISRYARSRRDSRGGRAQGAGGPRGQPRPDARLWPRHTNSRGWAICGWFCPVVNLWFPRRVALDTWDAGAAWADRPGPVFGQALGCGRPGCS
ncbi:DUF4328 domain-containing protein [Streptomyces collinus]|uniref:DUF4328 domain-containing protein n=1 Tax=Streptomyces collinus TaxID=42684 RepID=UPI00367782EF